MAEAFMIALRGYDMAQVDALLQQADDALASGSETLRSTARRAIQDAQFRQRLRGYARYQVDQALRDRLQKLT
ncbi:DivIVA domain-containing protein [Mangrovihabitans endophyticus]|uniref:DivIVA domain-containing protein n=1 Tax=Mangrovihabitans endophyticus TaxID=1751298 RepID=A0A8J3C0F9_9ACTN|nr:DivIVA domain-containing protein [Mangrovihabitans endophyticus]GGL00899.1 hypothetical protein GCM10012284_39320 [Mangrovihabitans endophyticus]